jgi:ABC-type polysaccharide/polyol phosphate transport system ATPase subunit
MPIIELDQVSKSFEMRGARPRSFQELFLSRLRRQERRERRALRALDKVSFSVDQGETLGVIGSNGSGKSTCLKLMTRILQPTSGTVRVEGRVSALLELGAGFHPELTGRDNVYLYGSILGLGRKEIGRRMEDIVEFAEVRRFMDAPIKVYSSGMLVRLAFATAVHVNPDILLVDEVLAVGDQSFQAKCLREIEAMRQRGVTIVFVSHGLDAVRSLCSRVIWLDHGILREDGRPADVVQHYIESVHFQDPHLPQREAAPQAGELGGDVAADAMSEPHPLPAVVARHRGRWGTREAEITAVRLLDGAGEPASCYRPGDSAIIAIRYRAHRPIFKPAFGLAIYRADGLHVSGEAMGPEALAIPSIVDEGEVRCQVAALPLADATYYLSVALFSQDQSVTYDYHSLLHPIQISSGPDGQRLGSVMVLRTEWSHQPRLGTERRQP